MPVQIHEDRHDRLTVEFHPARTFGRLHFVLAAKLTDLAVFDDKCCLFNRGAAVSRNQTTTGKERNICRCRFRRIVSTSAGFGRATRYYAK